MMRLPFGRHTLRVPTKAVGFTLIELLVATALTMFIMVILSQAFIAATQTFGDLKAAGELNKKLRTAATAIRSDLQRIYFSQTDGSGRLHGAAVPVDTASSQYGFFRLWQDQPTALGTIASGATPGTATITCSTTAPFTGIGAITTNSVLIVDSQNQEVVKVTSVNVPANQFTATFTNAHPAPLWPNTTNSFPIVLAEGADTDVIPTVLSTKHNLHFMVDFVDVPDSNGNTHRREDFMTAVVGGNSPTFAIAGPPAQSNLMPALQGYGYPAYRDNRQTSAGTHVYNSQFAEVVYFLLPNGNQTPGDIAHGIAPTPLFALYRRQLLGIDQADVAAGAQTTLNVNSRLYSPASDPSFPTGPTVYDAYCYEMSCKPDQAAPTSLRFKGPLDLPIPERRFAMTSTAPGGGGLPLVGPNSTYPKIGDSIYGSVASPVPPLSLGGADLLVNDVISFDTQAFIPTVNPNDFIYLPTILAPSTANTYYNLTYANNRAYDTWTDVNTGPYSYANNSQTGTGPNAGTIVPQEPSNANIYGLKLIIRVWDVKSLQTRQLTIVQDM